MGGRLQSSNRVTGKQHQQGPGHPTSMQSSPYYTWPGRIVFYILPILLFSSCVNDPAEVAAFEELLDEQIEIARDVTIYYSDSARVRVTIQAPVMHVYQDLADPRQEFPEGLFVTFFDEFQDTSSTLEAEWGIYRRRQGSVTVRNDVVWQSVDEQRLETEELNWNEREERIYTNKFVVLTQPDYIITGHGLEADPSFSNARVLQVDGRVPVERKP